MKWDKGYVIVIGILMGTVGVLYAPPPSLEFRYDRMLLINGEPFFPIGNKPGGLNVQ